MKKAKPYVVSPGRVPENIQEVIKVFIFELMKRIKKAFCHSGLFDPKDGQLVLGGDPKQLGPILRSPLALQHGLGEAADYLKCPVVF